MEKSNLFEQIRAVVKQIPEGCVANYGHIAELVGISNPKLVGWALNNSKDLTVPAHRVVKKDGSLAPHFSEDGWREQFDMLQAEGVTDFQMDSEIPRVNMEKYLWDPKHVNT